MWQSTAHWSCMAGWSGVIVNNLEIFLDTAILAGYGYPNVSEALRQVEIRIFFQQG